jgi:hypothetical protein
MSNHLSGPDDDALGRRLARELPRYGAPSGLRNRILDASFPRRSPWVAPLLSAAATALVGVLLFVQFLPRIEPVDPVQRLVRAVVSEHSRALMWGARRGDDRLAFLAAEPVYLERQRGMALHYRDLDGHLLSYVVLPAPAIRLPDRQRVQIERFRPVLARDAGFSTWVWKQGDLACFLVSDMVSEADLATFRDYFVRVRTATEPFVAY